MVFLSTKLVDVISKSTKLDNITIHVVTDVK